MSESTLSKTYNPDEIEARCYQRWEDANLFSPSHEGDRYCIMLPPPNVTGTLHMGHGFQVSLMDALIRYHRMRGFNTLWQSGADHAGIATQMVVERQLAQNGKKRTDIGREAFIDKVWEWKEQSGSTINGQLRRMGASLDWERFRFTMDEDMVHAVQTVFVKLYEEGLIYRGKTLVNWDPKLHTAISDLEVNNVEEQGSMWHIRYPIVGIDQALIVATTRPETLLGDAAVAVNPHDERYKKYIGHKVLLPISEREIPIIADDYVDMEFGTGCLKITPAHDFNDYEVGKRHNLPTFNILTPEAKMNEHVPKELIGLDRFEAREAVLKLLEEQKLLVKTEPHTLSVPRGDRSGEVLEPYLTDQWFVKAEPLAQPALNAVREGKIQFVPENWTKIYFQWLENIQDWCISRQLWWGHRIPAWYDDKGHVYVGMSEAEVRQQHHLEDSVVLRQDEDVLDTWFSSALWPFATLGWPDKTPELATFYPTSVLVTGFDIIFFWVARMVMMGIHFMDDVPFEKVYITGLIRDADGHKMSKSKGNILDPIDLIDGIDLDSLVAKRTANLMQPQMAKKIKEKTIAEYPEGINSHGTDALRFTYCALATTGRDIRFDMGRIEGYRNFTNKIWNAARYVLMNTQDKAIRAAHSNDQLNVINCWILSKLQRTTQEVIRAYEEFRFDWIAQTLYEFIWNEYCDWYLELAKPILQLNEFSQDDKAITRHTLISVQETILRLLHPMMPFITEEIWQIVAPMLNIKGESIMMQSYPSVQEDLIFTEAEQEVEWLKTIILAIRNIRGEMNISPAKTIPLLLNKGTDIDRQRIKTLEGFLKTLAKVESITWLDEQSTPPAATGLVDRLELLIPMSGLIDKEAELTRLNKELLKLQKDLTIALQKLSNSSFVDKAPQHVVEKEQLRAKELDTTIGVLQEKIVDIEKI